MKNMLESLPRENFRLQGFDDSFIDNILNISMTQQYKQAGNAVCPMVITGIVNHLQNLWRMKYEL